MDRKSKSELGKQARVRTPQYEVGFIDYTLSGNDNGAYAVQ